MRYFEPNHSVFEQAGWSDLEGSKRFGPLDRGRLDIERARAQEDIVALRAVLLAAVGCEDTLDLLLRWVNGEITYCQLGASLGIDRRTAKAHIHSLLAEICTKLSRSLFDDELAVLHFPAPRSMPPNAA